MFIKEIILDGFKSYCNRTVISSNSFCLLVEFDPHFNAITGFNGSGKSNIFDSICFLMGITSLSHVRVSNLQELIYKYGNAGIEKASVTIVFDNSHQDRICPIGMKDYKEVTVTRQVMKGGKSKYYLNGSNATNEKIKQLFQSVQLNVNNPHFLIMQGKVTQVAKMKPKELLSLLEEAAGTSLYEGKKRAAETTIEKKEKKLQEIEILSGPIQEKIAKHKKEKEMLALHRANEEQLGKIRRILVAHKYYEITKSLSAGKIQIKELEVRRSELSSQITHAGNRYGKIVKELEEQKGKQGPEIRQEIEKGKIGIRAVQKEHNIIVAELAAKEKELEQEHKDMLGHSQEIEEYKAIKAKRIKERDDLKLLIARHETEMEQKIQYIKALEDQVNSGGNASNKLNPMIERANNLEQHVKSLHEEIQVRENKHQALCQQRVELKQKLIHEKANAADFEKSKSSLIKELEKVNKELDQLETIGIDTTVQRKLAEEVELKRRLQDLADTLSTLQSRCHFDISVHFTLFYGNQQYKLPDPGFDRRKVHGRVISLLKLKDMKYAKALEYIAGGKLFYVVVDSEQVSKFLLEHECFIQRETCVPNNRISFRETPAAVLFKKIESSQDVQKIEEHFGGKVRYALNVIQHDERVGNTMKYVFGGVVKYFVYKMIVHM
eukprot:TRINITY_DN2_c0_g3_i1.p2 TRINITY_DN2_c0_g3~~TRINITY_DN2_c0_g3_i1.p2  ORF type:complete len:664 (+),score=101.84 TRINITY_DN2_c0_g3_i1:1978-3969(+)